MSTQPSGWSTGDLLAKLDFFALRGTLRGYNAKAFQSDICAAFNVALLAFPQGMAYALIAGLPIQFGIYASAVAAIVGAIFARSQYITLGPTNATSVLLLSAFASMNIAEAERIQLLPVIVLMSGLFLIIAAHLNIANLMQYVSRSVITGYITAAAILIITNQLANVLGFEIEGSSATFFGRARLTLAGLGHAHGLSVLVAGGALALYVLLQSRLPRLPNVALCLLALSIVTFLIPGREELRFLDAIDARDWRITVPDAGFKTINRMASVSLAIALLSMLEGVSIGKSLAARAGKRLDTNQEIFSMGMANLGCGLLSGMPASGSLTRSALNFSSGATGPMASLYNGVICAVGAFLIGPLIGFVPKSVLAVLVICIGVSLISRRQIRIVTRSTGSDALVFFTTLISGLLFPLDVAVYLGVGTSIVLFMRKAAMPQMVEYKFDVEGQLVEIADRGPRPDPQVSIVHVEGNLFFGAAELFRDQTRRIYEDENLRVIVLKLRNAHHLDATSVMALEELILFARATERTLMVSEVRPQTLKVFRDSGLLSILDEADLFLDDLDNPTAATAGALRRAKEIIGDVRAEVSIQSTRKLDD
jgi:SulP family sulfate permease